MKDTQCASNVYHIKSQSLLEGSAQLPLQLPLQKERNDICFIFPPIYCFYQYAMSFASFVFLDIHSSILLLQNI